MESSDIVEIDMLNIELEGEIFDIISSMNDGDIHNNTTFPT